MSYSLFDKDEHWHKPEQAFLTDDHRTILRFAVEALMSGKGAVLVTLVEIRGGAARPLGAQMVVREDGRYCGFVSGGCVEAAAAFEALEMMGSGRDREIRYGEGSPWFDIVLPCGGGITLTLTIPEACHGRILLEPGWQFEDGHCTRTAQSGVYRILPAGRLNSKYYG